PNLPTTATSSSPGLNSSSPLPTPIGAIVGGVVSGLVIIGALVAIMLWFRFKKRTAAQADAKKQAGDDSSVDGLVMSELPNVTEINYMAEADTPPASSCGPS